MLLKETSSLMFKLYVLSFFIYFFNKHYLDILWCNSITSYFLCFGIIMFLNVLTYMFYVPLKRLTAKSFFNILNIPVIFSLFYYACL